MNACNMIKTDEFLKPVRISFPKPVDFRVVVYPDGSAKVQGAYPWKQGWDSGVDWRDLPAVRVYAEGSEIRG